MLQTVTMNNHPAMSNQQPSAYTPHQQVSQPQEVVVVYINNDPIQNQTVASTTNTENVGTLMNPIIFERKQKNMLIIASFFMSLFFFLLIASLSLYIVFIFVLNFKTRGTENQEDNSIEEGHFTNLYGWPLWILVISLTFFMISLIMFVHRYRAYSIAVRRKMLFVSRQAGGVRHLNRQHLQQDDSNISITTEKPTDPSTIALFEDPSKTQPIDDPNSQITIKDNRVIPTQSTHQYDEPVVEYIHNPNVIQ